MSQKAFLSIPLNHASEVINITAEAAFLFFTVNRSTGVNLQMVIALTVSTFLGYSETREPSKIPETAWIIDINLAPVGSTCPSYLYGPRGKRRWRVGQHDP